MSFSRPGACALVAAVSMVLSAPWSVSQEVLKLEDQGVSKEFILVEDEVLLASSRSRGERLKDDVEVAIAGAKVLEVREGEALTKLPQRVDRRQAAAQKAAMQDAAGVYRSEPVLYVKDRSRIPINRRYVGQRVIVRLAEGQTLEQLRAQSGALRAELSPLPGHALLFYPDGWQSLAATEALAARGQQARPLLRRLVERMWVPNDPMVPQQWHIKNRGQSGGLVGADANLIPAWDMAKGAGVTVVVVDDSLETTHPDLAPNTPPVNQNVHRDLRDFDSNPAPTASDDAHGTSVAGVIAARGNNGIGVSGAAPEAQLLGVRLIGGFFDAQDTYEALTWQPNGFVSSISNNSWGYGSTGMVALDPLERQALSDAATTRRGGKGQVTLFAAANNDEVFNGYVGGNETFTSQDANYQPFANSRFVIGVAATTNEGDHSYYSNRGASVLISAPSSGGSLGIVTTDNTGTSGYNSLLDPAGQPLDRDYTNSFGGTSSATPLTAGVVALMLSANPNLGYRDVMEILATTARKIDPSNPDWADNGAGFHFAHAYGAGNVDAAAAVARSTVWTNLPVPQSQSRTASSLPAAIPDNSSTTVSRTFNFANGQNLRVEHVEVVVRATHPNRSDLEIILTSPSGKQSILNPIRVRPDEWYTGDDDIDIGDDTNGGWVYMSTHHWGENSQGTWTLTARDGRAGSAGTLQSAQVRIYGAPSGQQRVRFAARRIVSSEGAGSVNLDVQRLGGTSGSAMVDYAVVGGSASSGADFTLASGTLTFAAGQAQKSIPVTIHEDADPEGTEVIYVILSNPIGATLGGGSLCTLAIGDNDGNIVTITALDSDAAETLPGTGLNPVPKNPGSFAITRLVADPESLEVPIEVTGTAANGTDYQTIQGTITIPAGMDTAYVTITPIDDAITESSESVTLRLAPPDVGADYSIGEPDEATVNIRDNELPSVSVLTSLTQFMESDANGTTLTFSRGVAVASDLTVDLFIGGSAQAGVDYVELPDSVVIPSGQAKTTLQLKPKNNDVFNAARSVVLAIAPSVNYDTGLQRSVVVRLLNDEPVPDRRKPSVRIVSPGNKQRIDAPITALVAAGSAKDNGDVARVEYRVNGGEWRTADLNGETLEWSADIVALVAPGPNVLEVRARDGDGNFSGIAARPFTLVQPRVLTVVTNGDGTVSPGTGVREAGQRYSLTAKPQPGQLFAGWSGDLSGTGRTLSFVMADADTTVTASFIPNPFSAAVIGRYAGPVAGATVAPETTGFIDCTIGATGTFTGKLWYGSSVYKLRGEFNGQGRYEGQIARPKQLPLPISLTVDLDPNGTQRITGTIMGDAQMSDVIARRTPFGKTNPVPAEYARSYNFYIPPLEPAAAIKPQGYGVGTLSISSLGVVKWSGTLGDGTAVSQSTILHGDHRWPLYLQLYKGTGYIAGEVVHDPLSPASDLTATLDWIKPGAPRDRFFPEGFSIENLGLVGVKYSAPASGARVIEGYDTSVANAGPLSLVGGNLPTPGIAKLLTLLPNNAAAISPVATDRLQIRISAKTGIVSGSFVFPIPRKVTPIKGVILQDKINRGVGTFQGSTINKTGLQTGRLDFAPQP